ncbi:MAG: AAA family ATPase [Algicola sp.]|nr:AAA family ATPase [Algicola sp.]
MKKIIHGRIALNADTLKRLRKKKGLSQDKLADECADRHLQVSVASIKRAEAGKNVLYRIVLNLADFFDIAVTTLIEGVPITPWSDGFGLNDSDGYCIGRGWELQQLQLLYSNVSHRKKGVTAYVSGMAGLGKTHMMESFLAQLQTVGVTQVTVNANRRVSAQGLSPLSYLCRQLLGLPVDMDDRVGRQKAAVLCKTPDAFIRLMDWLGVELLPGEQNLLVTLKQTRNQQALMHATEALLRQLNQNTIWVLFIDDLHLADEDFVELIDALHRQIQTKPLLLLLCATNVGCFSHIPPWLDDAYCITLGALNGDDAKILAHSVANQPDSCQSSKQRAVERASGHPGLLTQLLQIERPCSTVPSPWVVMVMIQLKKLSGAELIGLQIAAVFGFYFTTEQVHLVLAYVTESAVYCRLPLLVYAGLIKHAGCEYCFQHPLIREVVINQLCGDLRRRISRVRVK